MKQSIPDFLYDKLENEYGKDLLNEIIEGYSNDRITTLRVNRLKSNIDEIKNILSKNNIDFEEVKWYKDALIIKNANEIDIQKLDIYEEGKVYLQSLSSMIPPIVLSPSKDENILDMTAAPGGKTTQMASISNNLAMITACESNKIRIEKLKYNIEKQGAKKVNVMLQDSRKLSDFFSFDKILLDAPCSGSGTININDKNLEKVYTEKLVSNSIKSQKELIKKAIKILKVGGELTYSTCSILKEENEEVLNEILKQKNVQIVPIDKNCFNEIPLLPVTIDGTVCVCPSKYYEGFFVSKIRKIDK